MNLVGSKRWILYIPLLAFAACLFATRAKADVYKGQFTLTSPVQWGDLVLEPGSYQFSLPSASFPCTLYIRGKGQSAVLNSAVCGQQPNLKSGQANSGLQLEAIDGRLVVRELDLPTVGLSLEYTVPKRIQLVSGAHTPKGNASGSGKQ